MDPQRMRGVPRLMSAVLLKGHGRFEPLECREDVPVPPAGSGEVLIVAAQQDFLRKQHAGKIVLLPSA